MDNRQVFRTTKQFNIYKIVDKYKDELLLNFKEENVNVHTIFKNEKFENYILNVKLYNFKDKQNVYFDLDWITEIKGNKINNEILVDKINTERLTNTLLINLVGENTNDIFIVNLTGMNKMDNKWIDNIFFSDFLNKAKIKNVIEQKIINPNSEIVKSDQKLKNNSPNAINDIGDFFSSIKISLDESEKPEELIKSIIGDSIKISDSFSTNLISKSGLLDLINLILNILKINKRKKQFQNLDFIKRENDPLIIEKLYHELIQAFSKGEIKERHAQFNDYKVQNFNIPGNWNFEKVVISNIFKTTGRFGNLFLVDSLKEFEKEIVSNNSLSISNFETICQSLQTSINIIKSPSTIYDESDLDKFMEWIIEEKIIVIKFQGGIKRKLSIFDLLDIWEFKMDSPPKSWFLLSGNWYKNDDSYSAKLENRILQLEKDVISFVPPVNLEVGYGKLIGSQIKIPEKTYNKILVAKNADNRNIDYILNTDIELTNTGSGKFELADTFIKKDDELSLIATKQSEYVSGCRNVFAQAIIAIHFLSISSKKEMLLNKYNAQKINYIILIHHEQDDVATLKNNVLSITFRKSLITFVNEARKYNFEPKIYILKKQEIDQLELNELIKTSDEIFSSIEYKTEFENFKLNIREIFEV